MSETLPVKILDWDFEIETDAPPLEFSRVVQFVDQKMRELREQRGIYDTMQLYRLAILEIAQQLFEERDARGHEQEALERKTDEIIVALDAALARAQAKTS